MTSDTHRPLSGKTVVVTRAPHQAGALRELLEEEGARVVEAPTIRIAPPSDPAPLRRAALEVETYDWIVFTSVNGVAAFREVLEEIARSPDVLEGIRSCAIGPATGDAMEEELGIAPDVVPEEYVAEAVLAALDGTGQVRGRRFLIPRAAEARETLPEGLEERGAVVDVVEAYRTLPGPDEAERLRRLLNDGRVDLLTFTASSTVRNFHDMVGSDVNGARVAVIGPITARTARTLGLPVDVEADEYTIPGLVEACVRWARGEGVG